MVKRISRRSMLVGLGGSVVALPFLDIMLPKNGSAQGALLPKRYVVMFSGLALGADGGQEHVTPATVGEGYEQTRGLAPLWSGTNAPKLSYNFGDLRSEFSVVSGLMIPVADVPGGRDGTFHASTPCPMLCGHRNFQSKACRGSTGAGMKGPTSDYLVNEAIGEGRRLLVYRAQYGDPHGYQSGSFGRISAGQNGNAIPPVRSPEVAYQELFQNFSPDAEEDPEATKARLRRLSVLDLVQDRANALKRRLGTADQRRLDAHFTEVRELELRIANLPGALAGCEVPTAPSDPNGGDESNWSNEDVRARLFCDLIYMAFACDLARSASLQLTLASCYLSAEHMTQSGNRGEAHELGHGQGSADEVADMYAWHISHMAYLADKLRNTPEGSSTMLDTSALVFVNEAGHGPDDDQDNASTHSSKNMLALVAGRAGGLTPGRHIRFNNDVHPAAVVATTMQAVGGPDTLGEINGGIQELFGSS